MTVSAASAPWSDQTNHYTHEARVAKPQTHVGHARYSNIILLCTEAKEKMDKSSHTLAAVRYVCRA